MEIVQEYLPVVIGVVVIGVFVVGLVLATRTEGGRQALAGGAVKFALAALALAERWLGTVVGSRSVGRVSNIQQARALLRDRS